MNAHMPKAILILVGLLAIGIGVLQLRQRSLELRFQAAQLHREIQAKQSTLWRQQVEIAEYTSPKIIASQAAQREGDQRLKSANDKDVAGARE